MLRTTSVERHGHFQSVEQLRHVKLSAPQQASMMAPDVLSMASALFNGDSTEQRAVSTPVDDYKGFRDEFESCRVRY